MTDRNVRFTAESVERGDRMVMAQVAHCSHPGCHRKQPIFNPKGSRIIPPALFKRKLQQHGWTVRGGVDPYCPDHSTVEVKKINKKQAPEVLVHTSTPTPIIVPTQFTEEPAMAATTPTPHPFARPAW